MKWECQYFTLKNRKMKALIIEDEYAIADNLETMLRGLRPEIDIVGVTTNIPDSVSAVAGHPDLDIVFSDIKIDDGLSFSVFSRVNTGAMVVFTTAYDEYAIKAFEYNCVDYLMKPVSKDALEKALIKCERWLPHANGEDINTTADDICCGRIPYRKRLLLVKGKDTLIRSVEDVCYIMTEMGNVRVYLRDGLWGDVDSSLSELATSLPSEVFVRVNRQAIVNVNAIDKMTPGIGRDTVITMKEPYPKAQFYMTQERKKNLLALLAR